MVQGLTFALLKKKKNSSNNTAYYNAMVAAF